MQSNEEQVADHTDLRCCQYCGQRLKDGEYGRECSACFEQAHGQLMPDDDCWHSGAELARFQYEAALGYRPDRDYWEDEYYGYYDDDDSD